MSSFTSSQSFVLLGTALVNVYNSRGVITPLRVLLDNGSQNSFITQVAIDKLGLTPYEHHLDISGVSLSKTVSNKMVNFTFHSRVHTHKKFRVICAVLSKITGALPQVKLKLSEFHIPADKTLADPGFSFPSQIDMLLGADVYYDLMKDGLIHLSDNLPYLQNTHLGWVVTGRIARTVMHSLIDNHCLSNFAQVSLHAQSEQGKLEKLVSEFWRIEEIPQAIIRTPDDDLAEKIFVNTTQILPDHRYQVDLPLGRKDAQLDLGDSFHIAHKRFSAMESKLQRHSQLKLDYTKFIDEIVKLDHGSYVPLEHTCQFENIMSNKYFLPHHAVIRADSVTTKTRVVFDGSCKSTTGVSLNDILLKGYQVQPNLYDILIRFRCFKYVITADIEKMFRQIKVNPKHRFLLNVLWKSNPQKPLQCIELSTVTYGTNCAPFLATRVLKDLADRQAARFPFASKALLEQTYMDDILAGCDSPETLKALHSQLNCLLNSAGFSLHKWATNTLQLADVINFNLSQQNDISQSNCPNKILGLKWIPLEDFFMISVPKSQIPSIPTKRKLLSTVAQVYDPLGFISPVVVIGKLLLQKIWLLKIDWDTEISNEDVLSRWKGFVNNLSQLANLKIPRCLIHNKPIISIQLHGFADASTSAYASCVYLRVLYSDNSVSCRLITSKSKVAPLKVISLPRLELCAALMLAKLVRQLCEIFNGKFNFESRNLWTDSTIALCWINSHPSRWTTFVSNRVAKLQELSVNCIWRHVKSSDNPADLPSRGVFPQDLIVSNLWFNGPAYLCNPELNLCDYDFHSRTTSTPDIPEERKVSLLMVELSDQELFWSKLFERFSSFSRLQRVLAYVIRAQYHFRKRITYSGPLTVEELRQSQNMIVKRLQQMSFKKEISELSNCLPLTNKNLLSFKPFLDSNGLLRVGGRLSHSGLQYDQKHPMLLPSKHNVVSMMLKLEHIRLGHAGPQTVLSQFRLRFWPLNGLREIKRIVHTCLTCHRLNATIAQQQMADLPRERTQLTRPFEHVGVDFGGPFLIKSSHLRKAPVTKAYLALFVCMSSKAVHLELVSSLSTEGFLQCLSRFISRRGNPARIYCDNATNFQGASNYLKDMRESFKQQSNSDKIKDFLAKSEIYFKFIPPRSPHWGGLWESSIKSAKFHIRRLIGETALTFEEFSTILTRIEAILNSRPLCALSTDPNDLQPLTPGHFLIGKSLLAYPERDISQIPSNRLSLWKQCSQIYQLFWKRWHVDYLNRLQQRPKWLTPKPNLKVNDLVLLKEEDNPPLRWPLGRIVEVYPGSDNKLRVVKVQTSNGTFTRSISKLCPLPINEIDEENFIPVSRD